MLRQIKKLSADYRIWRLLRTADARFKTRRQREAQNDFQALRTRLERENQLHALMLSQRHFRRSKL